jgi:hypothetical protein
MRPLYLTDRLDAFRVLLAALAVIGLIGLIVDRGWPFVVIALFGIPALCIWWAHKNPNKRSAKN